MKQPASIRIEIPTPCQQNWDEMTPCGQGRHCAQCNKTVIDFTTWSDAALHQFFSKDLHHVCGRFRADQLNHPIDLPPQPHSWFYRIVAAMGLSLIFAPKNTQAKAPPANVEQYVVREQTQQPNSIDSTAVGEIRGRVFDDKNQPAIGVSLILYRDTFQVAKDFTDFDGRFDFRNLDAGSYSILAEYSGYSSLIVRVPMRSQQIKNVSFGLDRLRLTGLACYEEKTSAFKRFWQFRWLRRRK